MKKVFGSLCLLLLLGLGGSGQIVEAQSTDPARYERGEDFDGVLPSDRTNPELAEKIQTGDLHLDDVFIFIVKLVDLGAKIAGSIAVIFLLYGGFQLMISGLSDDKEKAKTTIRYALTGLAVTFLAWLIVYLIKYQMLGGAG